MKNRRKQGKIFRSLLAVLMLTAMLVTSVLQPVFAGDYVAGTEGNLTLTVQQAADCRKPDSAAGCRADNLQGWQCEF